MCCQYLTIKTVIVERVIAIKLKVLIIKEVCISTQHFSCFCASGLKRLHFLCVPTDATEEYLSKKAGQNYSVLLRFFYRMLRIQRRSEVGGYEGSFFNKFISSRNLLLYIKNISTNIKTRSFRLRPAFVAPKEAEYWGNISNICEIQIFVCGALLKMKRYFISNSCRYFSQNRVRKRNPLIYDRKWI